MSYAMCGARRKQATTRCRRPAGWGTLHPGAGRCKLHAGSTVQGTAAAATELARRHSVETGVETTPAEFLQKALDLHAGEVEYCHERLRALADAGEVELRGRSPVMHWLRERDRALSRGCKVAAMMIKLGLGLDAERARIDPEFRAMMEALVEAVLDDLELTVGQRALVPGILADRLHGDTNGNGYLEE